MSFDCSMPSSWLLVDFLSIIDTRFVESCIGELLFFSPHSTILYSILCFLCLNRCVFHILELQYFLLAWCYFFVYSSMFCTLYVFLTLVNLGSYRSFETVYRFHLPGSNTLLLWLMVSWRWDRWDVPKMNNTLKVRKVGDLPHFVHCRMTQ